MDQPMKTTEAIGRAETAVCIKIKSSKQPTADAWVAVLRHLDAAREAFIEASRLEFERYVEALPDCECSPSNGVCGPCVERGAKRPHVPCCTGTAVLAGRACRRCSQ